MFTEGFQFCVAIFPLKKKHLIYSHPRYLNTHFDFWRTLARYEEALDPWPLFVSDLSKPLNHPGSLICKLLGLRTTFKFSWRAVSSGVDGDPCWTWGRKPAFLFPHQREQTAKLLSDFHTIFDLEGNAKFIKGQDNQATFCSVKKVISAIRR